MAKQKPSAYTPWPPNIRLTATAPTGSNRAFSPSASMSGSRLGGERLGVGRGDRDALAAAAGRGFIGVAEGERRRQAIDLEIHFRAEQKQNGLGVDQHLNALVLDDFVERRDVFGEFHRVGHAG